MMDHGTLSASYKDESDDDILNIMVCWQLIYISQQMNP